MTPQDPSMTGMEGVEPAAEGQMGYEICIKVMPDGQMSVGVEQPKAEAAEGSMEAQEGVYQPVQGMQGLMSAIAAILKSGGQVQDRAAEQAGFDQGFEGA